MLTYSGYFELGIAEVWDMIDRYFAFVEANGYFQHKRREQARYWMTESIDEALRGNFYRDPGVEAMLSRLQADVMADRRSSFTAAHEVLRYYFDEVLKK